MRSARATRDLESWRAEARALLAAAVPPEDVLWSSEHQVSLFASAPPADATPTVPHVAVPARFLTLARDALLHRAGAHALLYRLLWRLAHRSARLLDDDADPDVRALALCVAQVRRDLHRMHAFVRFRIVDDHAIAWYAPDHHILERGATFFVERFAAMTWTIITPERTVTWDGHALHWADGAPRTVAPQGDELEELWRTYYAAVFNPARANPRLLRQHIPSRVRPQLPEATLFEGLLASAAGRVEVMTDRSSPARTLPMLRDEARRCTACELCEPATQTVFGEGPDDARLVLVGEQPGDLEDLAGRPFIGPAGEVLDAALAEVGIDRREVYVTNAVKHFRFLPRGKKRLHQRATADQIRACKPWLGAELAAIRPRVVVCLGATAAMSLIGSRFRITQERGRVLVTHWAEHLLATHHPAAILRVDPIDRPRYEAELRVDLARARTLLDLPR